MKIWEKYDQVSKRKNKSEKVMSLLDLDQLETTHVMLYYFLPKQKKLAHVYPSEVF